VVAVTSQGVRGKGDAPTLRSHSAPLHSKSEKHLADSFRSHYHMRIGPSASKGHCRTQAQSPISSLSTGVQQGSLTKPRMYQLPHVVSEMNHEEGVIGGGGKRTSPQPVLQVSRVAANVCFDTEEGQSMFCLGMHMLDLPSPCTAAVKAADARKRAQATGMVWHMLCLLEPTGRNVTLNEVGASRPSSNRICCPVFCGTRYIGEG
jgi:hypothetical protein